MVKNSRQLSVILEDNGSFVQELHYGPYSRFWSKDHAIMGWNNENILERLKIGVEFFSCLIGKYKIFLYAIGSSSYEKWNYADQVLDPDRYPIIKRDLIREHSVGKKWELTKKKKTTVDEKSFQKNIFIYYATNKCQWHMKICGYTLCDVKN
ncbi:hypothetical protein C1645_858602 [Glomus cerebriforme]|uniref:Uncharacterized protein n=1 Tax=Glomus cerebriforme TaxID=658196 RepID=A0A397SFP0_9GLOM|nr:hypothetical protein C1645_858602 [Glomus cerebriforme]